MPVTVPHNKLEIEFEVLIELLKNAELVRDLSAFESLLNPYFDNDLSNYTFCTQAYLNRFLGFYYIHAGRSKNIAGHQDKGKDYLTKAIRLFEDCGLADEATESEISLGWSYYQTGETQNFEPFLLSALSRSFQDQETLLSIKVSLLVVFYKEKRKDEAFPLIEQLEKEIESCRNGRIVWQFYHNAGLVFRAANKNSKAVRFYDKAILVAQEIANKRFEGLTYNCLAFALLKENRLETALYYSEKSIEIFNSLGDTGTKADCLDTKALILVKQEKFDEALNVIIKAIAYFRKGESYFRFADALWNKIEILKQLGKKDSIVETFAELSEVAFAHLSLEQRREYFTKFTKLIIIPFGDSYDEMLKTCQREIVEPVVEVFGKTAASQRLKFNHHQTLSNLLKRLDINHKQPRIDAHDIRKIGFQNGFVFPPLTDLQGVAFYSCSPDISEIHFSTTNQVVLMVVQVRKGCDGELVLLKNSCPFIAEIVEDNGNFYFMDENGFNIKDDFRILGKIIGYGESKKNESNIFFKLI